MTLAGCYEDENQVWIEVIVLLAKQLHSATIDLRHPKKPKHHGKRNTGEQLERTRSNIFEVSAKQGPYFILHGYLHYHRAYLFHSPVFDSELGEMF